MKRLWLLIGGLLFLSGCDMVGAGQPAPEPKAATCFIGNDVPYQVQLEVADSHQERKKGLMGRTELGQQEGMLFTFDYERGPRSGFWMYKTLIPLDIAYLDQQGQIVSIRNMHPCPAVDGTNCPSYAAGKSYWYAVEMNAGYFADRNIHPGDRLVLPSSGESCDSGN